MKRKAPIEIGYRMIDELYRLFPNESDKKIARRLGCANTLLGDWKEGVTPSAVSLISLNRLGGDVMWVLLGGSRDDK